MAGVTEELRVLVEAEVERAIAQFEKLDKTVDKNEKQTKKLGDALDALSRKSLAVSAAFVGAGIASIKFAGELEKTQKSLEVLLRDAEKAAQIKDEWTALAAETPFQGEDIDRAGKMLLAFGIGADRVTDSLRQIGDISAAAGSGISDLADLYGKAKVQGRLFAEDMNQFQGRGIPVIQVLAKSFQTTESSIRQMVSEGKIGFKDLEKAITLMTGPGGQFEGMMEKLSQTTLGKFSTATDNAKLALSSFGEVLLPAANGVLDAATNICSAIQQMDDGTKRFIVTFGGIVAVSGPIIFAVHGINAALAALAANPAFLVIGGSVAAIGLVAGAISTYNNQLTDTVKRIDKQTMAAEHLLSSYENLNGEKALDKTTTDKLIKLYPQLSGKINAYTSSVDDARNAVAELNKAKTEDAVRGQTTHLQRYQQRIQQEMALLIDAGSAYTEAQKELSAQFKEGLIDSDTYKYELQKLADSTDVLDLNQNIGDLKEQFKAALADLNEKIKETGYQLNESLKLEALPITVKPQVDGSNLTLPPELKKKWQAWFEEITKVSGKKFEESGEKAGILYVGGLELTLNNSRSIAELLGDKFDLSDALKDQQDEIRKTLIELFNIDPAKIDQAFTGTDASVEKLVERFKALGKQVQALEYADAVKDLQAKIDDLAKSETDLAAAAHIANGYTEEQARVLADMNNELGNEKLVREYERSVKELGLSQEELARLTLVANGATDEQLERFDQAIKKIKEFNDAEDLKSGNFADFIGKKTAAWLTELNIMSAEAAAIIGNLSGQLAMAFVEFPFDALEGIGKAFAQGADAGDALRDSIAGSAQQLLDNLPMMFMQAGLQLIATPGMWPLGLGLLAAGGVLSFTKGFVNEKIKQKADGDVTENALGGVYGDGSYAAFAKGGVFTNSIVENPTLFRFAKGSGFGTGLMGEAGPEAIVPLTRMGDGSLGVAAAGGGAASPTVIITIVNNTGEHVTQKEQTNNNGEREIMILIGNSVSGLIDRGKFDGNLKNRYGLKVQGV